MSNQIGREQIQVRDFSVQLEVELSFSPIHFLIREVHRQAFPRSYVEDYLTSREEHEALLVHNDNCALVTMSTNQIQSTCFLINGWKRFAIANEITDEEECKIDVGVNDLGQIMLEFHKITI